MRGRRPWWLLFPVLAACGEDGVAPPSNGGLDSIPPEIVAVAPRDGAVGVPTSARVWVTFSEPINLATATLGSFFMVGNGTRIPGAYSLDGSTAAFTPDAPLDTLTEYTVTVTRAVRDPIGNQLTDGLIWSFTTGTNTPVEPAPADVGGP